MNNIKNRIDFLLEKKIENAQYELISTDQDAGVDDLLDVVNQIKKEYGQNSISIIDKSGHKSGNFISVYVDINLAEWKKTKWDEINVDLLIK